MEHILVRNALTYEEILNWRGFAFETGHIYTRKQQRERYAESVDAGELCDGQYGIAESDHILSCVGTENTFWV